MAIQFDGLQLADLSVLGLPSSPAAGEVAFDGALRVYSGVAWETFNPVDPSGDSSTITMASSAVIAADSGTGGAPSYTFGADSTLGMFYAGSDTIGMVGNGGAILNLAASSTPANFWQMESSDAAAPVELKALGGDTDIDMLISPKGDGVIQVPAGYETRSNFGDDSLVNKEYVDDLVTGGFVANPLTSDMDVGGNKITTAAGDNDVVIEAGAGSSTKGGDVDVDAGGTTDNTTTGGTVNLDGGAAPGGVGGSISAFGASGSAAGNAGGGVTIAGGAWTHGVESGTSGFVALTAGSTTTVGDGGDVQLTAGDGGATSGDGGNIELTPGAAGGGGAVGEIILGGATVLGGDLDVATYDIIGTPPATVTSAGGNIDIIAGAGGATSGAGGTINITSGAASGGGDESGDITIESGASAGGNTGDILVQAGLGTDYATKARLRILQSTVDLFGASGGANDQGGGDAGVNAGTGFGAGAGGLAQLFSGPGGATGDGGDVEIEAGDGGATSGDGGTVNIDGGDAQTSGDGGDVELNPGAGAGAGVNGEIVMGGNLNVNDFDIIGKAGSTSVGGDVDIIAGDADGEFDGGNLNLTAGNADGADSGDGGAVTITSGDGEGPNGFGGDIELTPGGGSGGGVEGVVRLGGVLTWTTSPFARQIRAAAAGDAEIGASIQMLAQDNASGVGGDVTIDAGTGGTNGVGGQTFLRAGAGSGSGAGGQTTLASGNGGQSGNGGLLDLDAGAGGTLDGDGGNVTITAGSASPTAAQNSAGGDITLQGGANDGSSSAGDILIKGGEAIDSGRGGHIRLQPGSGTTQPAVFINPQGGTGNPGELRFVDGAGSEFGPYLGLKAPAAVAESAVFEMAPKVVNVTGTSATINEDEDVVTVDPVSAGGAVTLTLHEADHERFRYLHIKIISQSALYTVTVQGDAGAETIDGAVTYVFPINSQWSNLTLVNDRSAAVWYIL